MSDTCRRDTLWIPYGYRGHMGSGITLSINDGNRDVGVATIETLGVGWSE